MTVNNPFIIKEDNMADHHICKEPFFEIDGAVPPENMKPDSMDSGYSYMCKVPDFMQTNYLIFDGYDLESVGGVLSLPLNFDNHGNLLSRDIFRKRRHNNITI